MTSPIHSSGGYVHDIHTARCAHRLVFGMVVGLYQPLADDERGTPSSDQTCLLQSLQKTKKKVLTFFFGLAYLTSLPISSREQPTA